MTACTRCGYPDLTEPVYRDGLPYGPDCAAILERGGPETPGAFSLKCRPPRMVTAWCPRCGDMIRADTPRERARQQRAHRCST